MNDISRGYIAISKDLIIYPGFLFEQFKKTKYYKKQDGVRIIYLDELQVIDNRKYVVSLFFRSNRIYMVSLICCDKEFNENEEHKRKQLHDDILRELGIESQIEYSWGKISSDYDAKSNISSINFTYLEK